MSGTMTAWGKAIVACWQSAWWQLYLGALLAGLLFGIGITARIRDQRRLGQCGSMLRFLLYFGAAGMSTTILLTFMHRYDSPWVAVCDLYDHVLGFFVDSVFAVLLSASLVRIPRLWHADNLSHILFHPQTIEVARLWLVIFWVSCGVLKIMAHETLEFFHLSGYSSDFFFFIAAWELGCGMALAWRPTASLSLCALSVDMLGAIYTHYHNYIVHGFAGPLVNSLDALRMLVLMAYVALGLGRTKRISRSGRLKR